MQDALADRVSSLAQAILDRLGQQAPQWTVREVAHNLPEPPDDLLLSVTLGPADDGENVTAYYDTHRPPGEAAADFASQIQDHAIEASWGQALPPCPGHTHPLRARVCDGVAVWECPASAEHLREPMY